MTDHLHPEEGSFAETASTLYTAALARLLLPDGARRLQMVTLPSFEPESAVYIREKWPGPQVIATRMEKHFWSAMMERVRAKEHGKSVTRPLDAFATLSELHPTIEVARAPIGEPLLGQLKLLWREALFATRHPARPLVVLDGTRFHFGASCREDGTLTGKTWSPPDGLRMAGLVDVGTKLALYAWAPEEQRAGLEEVLLADVSALLPRFASLP
jgi:hypothetical protein